MLEMNEAELTLVLGLTCLIEVGMLGGNVAIYRRISLLTRILAG